MRSIAPLIFACALALPIAATAQVEANFWTGGGVRVGISSTTCNSSIRGALRFNDTSKEIELCNGTVWTRIVNTVTSGPVAPAGSGYFVLTATTWNGNLGGVSGADAKCLAELTGNTNWKYYSAANSNGQLVASKVHAWIASVGLTNNLMPLTTYYFARVGDVTVGGGSFTTDGTGQGPGDSNSWAAANYFSGTFTYWAGRYSTTCNGPTFGTICGQGCSGVCVECSNWGATSGSGTRGNSAGTSSDRWATGWQTCVTNERLICYVDP